MFSRYRKCLSSSSRSSTNDPLIMVMTPKLMVVNEHCPPDTVYSNMYFIFNGMPQWAFINMHRHIYIYTLYDEVFSKNTI